MKASLRALLTNVIDYAGLFPPASLSLDESIRNYARYLKSDDRWMLGRFICPAAKLEQLRPYVDELFSAEMPVSISALGRASKTDKEFNQAIELDFADMARFRDAAAGRSTIDAFETRIASSGGMTLPGTSRDIYLEPAPDDAWRLSVEFIVAMRSTGLKVRTGGVEAAAFPKVEQLAFAIASAAAKDEKRTKFTAGLHHPIRHFNNSVDTKMHGFINVFVAGVLANARGLDEPTLIAILSDEDAGSFRFDDESLGWRDYRASVAEIEQARRERVISFGSCSFDEPREDLRALGWL